MMLAVIRLAAGSDPACDIAGYPPTRTGHPVFPREDKVAGEGRIVRAEVGACH